MLKMQVERHTGSESEKEVLQNKLEIFSLRFKSMDILHKKLELLDLKKPEYGIFEEGEYQKALGYFQRTVELSPDQPVNFSKIDLELPLTLLFSKNLSSFLLFFIIIF